MQRPQVIPPSTRPHASPVMEQTMMAQLHADVMAGREARKRLAEATLSPEERERLQALVARGEEALETIVRSNQGLVHRIVSRLAISGIPFEDLLQAGQEGLLEAIYRFDPERGNRFSTYAVWRITHAVQEAIREMAPAVVSSSVGVKRAVQANAIRARLAAELGREPTVEEVAAAMRTTPETVASYQTVLRPAAPIDDLFGLSDPGPDVEESVFRKLTREEIENALQLLPPRHRKIIRLVYGLGKEPPHSMAEAGKRLGVGRERARQLKNEALARLKASPAAPRLRALMG